MTSVYVVTRSSIDMTEVLFVCDDFLKTKFKLKQKLQELFPWLNREDIIIDDEDGICLFDTYRFEITEWQIEK